MAPDKPTMEKFRGIAERLKSGKLTADDQKELSALLDSIETAASLLAVCLGTQKK